MSERDAIVAFIKAANLSGFRIGEALTYLVLAIERGDHLTASVAGRCGDSRNATHAGEVERLRQEIAGNDIIPEGDHARALVCIERLRDALARSASRFEIAAENAKERAPVFRKWAQEARQALEAIATYEMEPIDTSFGAGEG